jgi:hypothetical protein
MDTTMRRPPRRETGSLVAAVLVALLTICAGTISVARVLDSPARDSAEGVSGHASPAPSAGASVPVSGERGGSSMRIELVAGDETAIATLGDTPEARTFAAMLPITVDMEDPFGQAKTGRLPGALDVEDATRSRSYAVGDLSYWSPSGSLAVVYDALGRSVPPPGLVRLGRVQTGLEAVAKAGNDFAMTIRHAPKEDH